MSGLSHVPVMLDEVMAALAVGPGAHVVDGTFGGGGYAAAALARGAEVTGFDRDPRAVERGAAMVAASGGRLRLVNRTFAHMADELGEASVDAVALDLGYSSIQMDDPAYGLSFQADGPLDMRLSGSGESAADFLNTADEAEIADVLFHYGEEPAARRIARAIVADRPFHGTGELAGLVRRVVKAGKGSKADAKRDPATRSFQAIRIRVNDELGELERGLEAAEAVLKPGGRLAVVSFHSLEDRIVKRFLAERSGSLPAGSRHLPQRAQAHEASFGRPARAERPGEREVAANPRARSATLRVARRSAAPAWGAMRAGPQAEKSEKEAVQWRV
ncbi:16S rRNA (cytosine(1402)-N(4))-methyltransferase RsmH [Sandaracinobacter sp. RS1-74]|uniref:16S rRNA (cytosine(1402)-N(4))-methyltransferase RsmH n=1 Tax=Sandaracinobacteroides sayramensis TaxID=2913411 RepID=UPI001EDA739A|nr:16S rRNA (cytosine(1402)-N(4))-methyltransferase RsmH [Sandaracinobacteroides sayramensis]MCG2840482.1 16S rRNA (cytosine(1402)-N(4))-methyltransferase RsmH [Sandaracinobacteroides sayramensis]